jgi:hypothetical protein
VHIDVQAHLTAQNFDIMGDVGDHRVELFPDAQVSHYFIF